ncbi:hypothetical protein H9X87_11710 [Pseudoflavonifractor capillosus]|uniref:hypothetical protein n=1 Tax=Pseudoflavonifractor capillosus TaxID=106588 RepID=UPI001958EC15|nr:hypothetical protein [Pseudoflavonifractor capillosus]MBM6695403.1 hypothetical protein [Pseudoflavonifractor capillosus]
MASNKIQTGLRLNEAAYDKLRILSSREARSLNNLIEYILQKYLDEYESKNGAIVVPKED